MLDPYQFAEEHTLPWPAADCLSWGGTGRVFYSAGSPHEAVASSSFQTKPRYLPSGRITSAEQITKFSSEITGSDCILLKVRLEYLMGLSGFHI